MPKEVAVAIKFKVNNNSKTIKISMVSKRLCMVEYSSEARGVLVDVWGLAKNTSMGGCRFYVTFIDDCSRKVCIYFMHKKSEVSTYFENFKAMNKNQTGNFVQCLRLDGGGEYFSHEFSNFLKKHGTQRQFSCRYTPQQNGVAECKNKHIVEVAQALMSEKNMPPCYWAEAASTAVYTMNKTPTATVHDMTLEEKFTGKKPDVSNFLNAQSQVLSGPQGSSASSQVANLWSGRLRKEVSLASSINVSRKGKEKVDEGMRMPNVTAGHDDVDGHSSGSEHSLDEELGIPFIRTPSVRRLHAKNRAPSSNAEPRRSGRNRYPIDRLTYDGYVAKHFAFMAKVAQDVEPIYFEVARSYECGNGCIVWQ
ncbi:hypothetical protein L7F22_011094 [Adiantum nelumboides]|nr:hypothetical protein [Adiantum nelumboides]